MALIGVNPAEYTPADKLSIVYVDGDAFQAKDSQGNIKEVSAAGLKVLGLTSADLPAVVFTEDVPAVEPTTVNVSGVNIARSAKASTKAVEQIANTKVDKAVFASAITSLDIKVDGIDSRVEAAEEALEKLGDVEGGSIADALAKKVDNGTFTQYQSQVTEALAGKVDNGTLTEYQGTVTEALAGKVSNGDLEQYKGQVTEALAGKVDNSALNSYKEEVAGTVSGLEQSIGTKLSTEAFNTFKSDVYDAKMSALDGQIADRYTKSEVDSAIATQVASVLKFKGSVADIDALDAIEVKVEGDVYHVESTKAEFVWVGPKGEEAGRWEELGLTVSLDGYATEAYVQGYTYSKGEADAKFQTIEAAGQDKEALQSAINGKVAQGDFDALNAAVTGEGGLEDQVAANAAQVALNKAAHEKNASDIQGLDSYIKGENGVDSKIAANASAIAGLESDVNGEGGIASRVAANETAIADRYTKAEVNSALEAYAKTADVEATYATKDELSTLSGKHDTLAGTVAEHTAAIEAHSAEYNTLNGKVAANELAISNIQSAQLATVFVKDASAKALELNKWYVVSAKFVGTLPAGKDGDIVRISVVEGGSGATISAQAGETVIGSANPCMLGVTEDGFAVYNETYVFVYDAASKNWNVL